jgi:hypothetical protein
MVPGIDLYVVHLIRDGRGVITSHRKASGRDVHTGNMWNLEGNPVRKKVVRWIVLDLISVVRWIVRNLVSEWVCVQIGPKRTLRLRYEDFVADPKTALKSIGSLLDLDLTDVADAASSGKPIPAGHNVGGNRTKESGFITLRPDAKEWKTALSSAEQQLSWILMGWLMRRYGYDR